MFFGDNTNAGGSEFRSFFEVTILNQKLHEKGINFDQISHDPTIGTPLCHIPPEDLIDDDQPVDQRMAMENQNSPEDPNVQAISQSIGADVIERIQRTRDNLKTIAQYFQENKVPDQDSGNMVSYYGQFIDEIEQTSGLQHSRQTVSAAQINIQDKSRLLGAIDTAEAEISAHRKELNRLMQNMNSQQYADTRTLMMHFHNLKEKPSSEISNRNVSQHSITPMPAPQSPVHLQKEIDHHTHKVVQAQPPTPVVPVDTSNLQKQSSPTHIHSVPEYKHSPVHETRHVEATYVHQPKPVSSVVGHDVHKSAHNGVRNPRMPEMSNDDEIGRIAENFNKDKPLINQHANQPVGSRNNPPKKVVDFDDDMELDEVPDERSEGGIYQPFGGGNGLQKAGMDDSDFMRGILSSFR